MLQNAVLPLSIFRRTYKKTQGSTKIREHTMMKEMENAWDSRCRLDPKGHGGNVYYVVKTTGLSHLHTPHTPHTYHTHHTYSHIYLYTYPLPNIYHTHLHTNMHTYTMHIHMNTYHIYTHTTQCIHTHMFTKIYLHMHTHTHTHTAERIYNKTGYWLSLSNQIRII